MKKLITLFVLLATALAVCAANVTVHADNEPADAVFHDLMQQTGMNFVYSADALDGLMVKIDAENKPLKRVLAEMFRGTGVKFKIRGNDVILKGAVKSSIKKGPQSGITTTVPAHKTEMLDEIIVLSRLEAPAVETTEIGARKLTANDIKMTPALLGEQDALKALQMQPGISDGGEGMAGMHVHGGAADENLYMLDNIPLYHINHAFGFFSAFNPDVINYIDFYKSSIPAKYDGRLSSALDVRTKNGNHDGHHGSAKLGLTSGAVNVDGPIDSRTTYSVGLRRSWLEVITAPMIAIANTVSDTENSSGGYSFTDLNAKISHRLSEHTSAYISCYFGEDRLNIGSKDKKSENENGLFYENHNKLNWGNIVAQAGVNHLFNNKHKSEFTLAFTRYFSSMKSYESIIDSNTTPAEDGNFTATSRNNINDWIARADFDWTANEKSRVRYGANLVLHSFLPSQEERKITNPSTEIITRDSTSRYIAAEANAYIEDDWKISRTIRANAGIHLSLFHIDRKLHGGISPRLSVNWHPLASWAFKAAYTRSTQYVHQLTQSYMALPTDHWVPITGDFKPQTADKIAVGAYWSDKSNDWNASIEMYYKFMHNLIDYRDEYYLAPPLTRWDANLTTGKGTAKGIDFKVEKNFGKVTGHLAYSLAWTDRTFKEKNNGRPYPARFDHRHTINLLLCWKINEKVTLSAAWTGRSGNRYTLMTQVWESPSFGLDFYRDPVPLQIPLNNYSLPFYHRLDLSCMIKNRRGYWTFGIYNAYCNLNTVAIQRYYTDSGDRAFRKVSILPFIPSISYTWQF